MLFLESYESLRSISGKTVGGAERTRFFVLVAMIGFLSGCNGSSTPKPWAQDGAIQGSPPSRETVKARVIKIVARQFGKPAAEIAINNPIMGKQLQGDDLDIVELVMELEDQFNIRIPDELLNDPNSKAPLAVKRDLSTMDLIRIVDKRLRVRARDR